MTEMQEGSKTRSSLMLISCNAAGDPRGLKLVSVECFLGKLIQTILLGDEKYKITL